MAKGGRGWGSSQNVQNSMNSKIDRLLSRRIKSKSKKELSREIFRKHEEALKPKTFFEIYPTFSEWEQQVILILGSQYNSILMEIWEYCDDIPKIAAAPRNWIKENLYKKSIGPKLAVSKIREKVYG